MAYWSCLVALILSSNFGWSQTQTAVPIFGNTGDAKLNQEIKQRQVVSAQAKVDGDILIVEMLDKNGVVVKEVSGQVQETTKFFLGTCNRNFSATVRTASSHYVVDFTSQIPVSDSCTPDDYQNISIAAFDIVPGTKAVSAHGIVMFSPVKK